MKGRKPVAIFLWSGFERRMMWDTIRCPLLFQWAIRFNFAWGLRTAMALIYSSRGRSSCFCATKHGTSIP